MNWGTYEGFFPKMGVPPNHINFSRFFHYKPSILGYPHFRKPPYLSKRHRNGRWVGSNSMGLNISYSNVDGLPSFSLHFSTIVTIQFDVHFGLKYTQNGHQIVETCIRLSIFSHTQRTESWLQTVPCLKVIWSRPDGTILDLVRITESVQDWAAQG